MLMIVDFRDGGRITLLLRALRESSSHSRFLKLRVAS